MKKKLKGLGEAMVTAALAVRYSFAFCWRNGRKETVGRLFTSLVNTVLSCFLVQMIGWVINVIGRSLNEAGSVHTLSGFVHSKPFGLVVFMVVIMLVGKALGQLDSFYRGRWRQVLSFANNREMNGLRGSLDIARWRSKEFDDLDQRIDDLPSGTSTRFEFAEEVFDLTSTVVSFVLFGASLLWYKPIYALVLLVTAWPMVIVRFRLSAMGWNLSNELVPQYKKRSMLQQAFNRPVEFIQALMFGQIPVLDRQILSITDHITGRYDKIRKTRIYTQTLSSLVMSVGFCVVIVHVVWLAFSRQVEVGTFTIIFTGAKVFQGSLESIVSTIADQWNSAKGVILIEKDFFGLKPLLTTKDPVKPSFGGPPTIRFDRVSFAYPSNPLSLVLKDISFEINPGQKIAIVGKSGNGKSTLQSLLTREYDPTSGTITVNGVDLRNITPADWYKTVSALTQDYAILNRTIEEEIASSRPGEPIEPEEVQSAATFADFAEVVSGDPKGFSSQIGTEFGGREFSGGEKQRLALARVRYRRSSILVLDEPDSKLDVMSARKVMDRVFALSGVTVIMITQHVSNALRCDRVIVMGKGEIVENGRPEDLLTRGGVFASMFKEDQRRCGISE